MEANSRPSTPHNVPRSSPTSSIHSSPSASPNSSNKRNMISAGPDTVLKKPRGTGSRRGDHLKDARAALDSWRIKTYFKSYSPSPFTTGFILPDPVLTALASSRRISTVDDLRTLSAPWLLAQRHGQEVIDVLARVDNAEKAERERGKLERRAVKAQQTLAKRNAMNAEKERQREEREKAKQIQRDSALRGSTTFNTALVSTYIYKCYSNS